MGEGEKVNAGGKKRDASGCLARSLFNPGPRGCAGRGIKKVRGGIFLGGVV